MNKQIEIAWLAGIIEGEGCFGIVHRTRSKNGFRIRIRMTDEDIIKRISIIFNTKYFSIKVPQKHKSCYEITTTGKNAENIFYQILPYLGDRRRNRGLELIKSLNKESPF